ncbi:hypothetical protein ACIBG5_02780 [Kribbella sp. NPDC050241]|uniref:hypothetical protein n=1 Tax=Kribbella sp. NPDC050241 TaxID=3364115 RepID=UPI0037B1B5D4
MGERLPGRPGQPGPVRGRARRAEPLPGPLERRRCLGRQGGRVRRLRRLVVENSVFVPVAGGYTLHVGYANGSGAAASHGLVVNGNNQGSVSYPVTGWDNWQQSSVQVTLNAGWNTIRLTKGDLYTEVDYLEVQ